MGNRVDFPAGISRKAIEQYSDVHWRLRNLYYIKNERGERVLFQPNWVQEDLLDEMWFLNLIPKARQLGVTTLIDLFLLDAAVWNGNIKAAIIADSEDKAKEIFDDKIKFAYDNLPDWVKHGRGIVADNQHRIEFDNGSAIIVGVSIRGLTVQYLHVSELGRIARRFPDKAEEIKTGALNTVHAGQFMFIESTSEGREGLFFELCDAAMKAKDEGRELTPMSFKLHFYAWWLDARYTLSLEDARKIVMTGEDRAYFAKVEAEEGIDLTLGQRAWYVAKKAIQQDKMQQEYPSTLKEAFEVSIEGAYFAKEMTKVRAEGRILQLPWLPHVPVNTFWDLGHSDYTSIWCHQHVYPWNRFLSYYQNSGEQIAHYIGWLQAELATHAAILGTIYLPHDATNMYVNSDKSAEQLVREGLPGANVVVLPRPNNKNFDGIEASRRAFASCQFDREGTHEGVRALDHFRKEWNDLLGCFRDKHLHNWASHGYDAWEQFARGFQATSQAGYKRPSSAKRSHRTV